MPSTRLFVVDAFTSTAFHGNPAGVVLLDTWRDDRWLQLMAAEMRHSETAFVVRRTDGSWDLRWFTPTVEVDLCGHATLATAHILEERAVFHTRSGPLTCERTADGWITMDFPADPLTALTVDATLTEALGTLTISRAGRGVSDILVEVPTTEDVRKADPDLARVARLNARGVIVTAWDDRAERITSRCFYPAVGVPEDPVTGSAHCTIASWWHERLARREFTAEQLSPRGGLLRLRHDDARVHLSGQAVTVWSGETPL